MCPLVYVDGDAPGMTLHPPGHEPELVCSNGKLVCCRDDILLRTSHGQLAPEHGQGVGPPGLLHNLHLVSVDIVDIFVDIVDTK